MADFFLWTIYFRSSFFVIFIAFVLLDFVKPQLILFGTVDLLGAVWILLTLRAQKVPLQNH